MLGLFASLHGAVPSPLFPPYLLLFPWKLRPIHKKGGYCQVREHFPFTMWSPGFQGKHLREAWWFMTRWTTQTCKRKQNNPIQAGWRCYSWQGITLSPPSSPVGYRQVVNSEGPWYEIKAIRAKHATAFYFFQSIKSASQESQDLPSFQCKFRSNPEKDVCSADILYIKAVYF